MSDALVFIWLLLMAPTAVELATDLTQNYMQTLALPICLEMRHLCLLVLDVALGIQANSGGATRASLRLNCACMGWRGDQRRDCRQIQYLTAITAEFGS